MARLIETEPKNEKIVETLKLVNLTLATYIALGLIAWGGQDLATDKNTSSLNQNLQTQIK